ncbi:zinc-dependent metalloprotease, partial [Flavobacteriales bacterium]|nr:zinc-dependent metalloprotease [Flavobacteriales bacterium]
GDLNVEFRLAKIDPLGNPTSGIIRVRSELTNEPEPRDAVKALSYWNSYQYFNIWTLKKFQPQDDGNTLLGYAQFPNSGRMSTDGVVLLASQMVSGGTLTHECGHWLGLRHVWGDAECGDDNVKDTPPAREPNFGINLSDFPYHVGFMSQGCVADSLNPAGEMFVNYMDYSSDAHVTMFTKGQNEVMNETLEGLYDEDAGVSGIGFREYMWSVDNIALSGVTDGFITPICNQNTDFVSSSGKYSMCLGENIVLKGNKTQFPSGTVSSMIWDYGDGNTDNSNANLVAHTYSSAGSYNLSLTIEYNETTEARASNLSDLDLLNATSYDSIIETLIIQGTESELVAAGASNISLHLDDDGYSVNSYWENGVYYPDTLFYRGDLEQITYIAYYINSCSSTTLKENFITISPTSSSNTAGTYIYDFEDASELSADWQVTKAVSIGDWSFNSIENSSWDWINGVAVSGSAGLMINKNNLTLGEADELISVAYDLSALTSPAIKFSWSGASLNTFPVNEVNIYFSYDCGGIWRTLGSLTNVQVASAGIYITNFKPTTDEWNDTVMTNNQLKNDNIKFKFEYVTNGIANNFYLDNIEIGEAATLMLPNSTIASRVSIYPNPADGKTFIELNNLANKQIEVKLVNILGAEIMHLFSGEIVSNSYMINNIDLSHLETGIYFVKVVADGDIVMTDKLILK